jgi:hypothetical protein
MGLDTKTYFLTDRQSQCDFDFEFDKAVENSGNLRERISIRELGRRRLHNDLK